MFVRIFNQICIKIFLKIENQVLEKNIEHALKQILRQFGCYECLFNLSWLNCELYHLASVRHSNLVVRAHEEVMAKGNGVITGPFRSYIIVYLPGLFLNMRQLAILLVAELGGIINE
jgi:hypothetical protein